MRAATARSAPGQRRAAREHEVTSFAHRVHARAHRAHAPWSPGTRRPVGDRRSAGPRAERGAPHRLRQRHDGDPLRPADGAAQPPLLRHHPRQGRRAARLRGLAPLPAVHRAALAKRRSTSSSRRPTARRRRTRPTSASPSTRSSWCSRGPRSAPSSCCPATPTSRASSSSSRSTASTSSASASASRRATCSCRIATSTTATTRSRDS